MRRLRNDPAQYDDLTAEWWDPFGRFAALHWLAAARAELVPEPPRAGALLLDVACGGGLLAPELCGSGWRHVGLDLSSPALLQARPYGVTPVRGDALRLPFADGVFDCVVAGEVLEHLPDLDQACVELGRVLAPGGVLVLDTIADSLFARIGIVRIAERLPGGPPAGIHDPDLLVDPERLRHALGAAGVRLGRCTGLRPSLRDYVGWLRHRTPAVRMIPVRSTAGAYRALGTKEHR